MLNVSQFFTVKSSPTHNLWLHRFAVLTALATLGLIGLGGRRVWPSFTPCAEIGNR